MESVPADGTTFPHVERLDETAPVSSQCAVVGGATGALGGAIVRSLRRQGLRVLAVSRSADVHGVSDDPDVVPVRADLEDDGIVDALASTIDRPVRMVVQAAGLPAAGDIDAIGGVDLATGINRKVGGFLRLIRAAHDHLEPGSRLVALGGHYGFEPTPQTPMAGAINAALANVVRSLADRYGPDGVTVHLIAPGPVDSPRMQGIAERIAVQRADGTTAEDVLATYRRASPLGRLTTIEEVAWAVTMVLAPEASALHGSTLSLDAGRRRGVG
jgi:NAD(P)-dependent dehydrogenase (short-subunit alcohol dehydrogenase family)